MVKTATSAGFITQIIGPVVDAEFPNGKLPKIYNAIIIGEETGANVAGSNAAISGKIILPNSKVIVHIPLYHLYHDIDVKNKGRGLMPDYPSNYTKKNVLNGEDVDMKKVFELVK